MDPSNRAEAPSSFPETELTGGVLIDFHSPEFNRIDDLNDYSGNCTSFEPLDGIITSDMRHQMARSKGVNEAHSATIKAASIGTNHPANPQTENPESATPLTLISLGRTLIIATDSHRALACQEMLKARDMDCTVLIINVTGKPVSLSRLDRRRVLMADSISITGAFCCFSTTTSVSGESKESGEFCGKDKNTFDLVLDLQDVPSFAGNRLPAGYYAPGGNPTKLQNALVELPEMRGRFQKPQFTIFAGERCLRGRSRTGACRQCLDVCAAGAIQATDGKIKIDQILCQGCGGCATVCPTDAIRLIHPSHEDLLRGLQEHLNRFQRGADGPFAVIITDLEGLNDAGPAETQMNIGEGILLFPVDQIGHAGAELLLSCLALGARKAVVGCSADNAPALKKAIEQQVQLAQSILAGLALREDRLRFVELSTENFDSEVAALEMVSDGDRLDAALQPWDEFSPGPDRRTTLRMAVRHLRDLAGSRQSAIPLPPGSPFGALSVDAAACTLCRACIAACPAGALSSDNGTPGLRFRESGCHQCGLCQDVCPEKAIRLNPQLLCYPQVADSWIALNAIEPFHCVECGAPFASAAMVCRMEEKLRNHWMYSGEQARRLRMCDTCRIRDVLTAQKGTPWSRL